MSYIHSISEYISHRLQLDREYSRPALSGSEIGIEILQLGYFDNLLPKYSSDHPAIISTIQELAPTRLGISDLLLGILKYAASRAIYHRYTVFATLLKAFDW